MKERPILFSGPMVRAIIEGRKTQTRRIFQFRKSTDYLLAAMPDGAILSRCPYGQPGDRLWVRETAIIAPPNFSDNDRLGQHVIDREGRPRLIQYLATAPDREGADNYRLKATPSIHMPRWASRLTLEITEVRVERLQVITEVDAKAEGVDPAPGGSVYPGTGAARDLSYRAGFAPLWDRLNGDRARWASNPWCWAVSFKVAEVRQADGAAAAKAKAKAGGWSAFWKELDEKGKAELGQALRAKGWVLTGWRPVWSAAPIETRKDIGRIECSMGDANEITAATAEELLERIEAVEKAAKARTTCCEGECPECFGSELEEVDQ